MGGTDLGEWHYQPRHLILALLLSLKTEGQILTLQSEGTGVSP